MKVQREAVAVRDYTHVLRTAGWEIGGGARDANDAGRLRVWAVHIDASNAGKNSRELNNVGNGHSLRKKSSTISRTQHIQKDEGVYQNAIKSVISFQTNRNTIRMFTTSERILKIRIISFIIQIQIDASHIYLTVPTVTICSPRAPLE